MKRKRSTRSTESSTSGSKSGDDDDDNEKNEYSAIISYHYAHYCHSFHTVDKLRLLFNSEKFSDLKVRFPKSNTVLHLHRNVVCQSSEFFEACLRHDMKESNDGGVVTMSEEDDEELMTELLRSCYSVEMTELRDMTRVVPMIQLAKKYQFHVVLPNLARYLMENIDVEMNIFQCLDLVMETSGDSDQNDSDKNESDDDDDDDNDKAGGGGGGMDDMMKQVKTKLQKVLQSSSKRILEEESYLSLDVERWKCALRLMTTWENRLLVYDAVHSWLRHDANNRCVHAIDLMDIVKEVTPPVIFDVSHSESDVSLSVDKRRIKKKTSKNYSSYSLLGTKCNEFSIRLLHQCRMLMVGMAPKTSFNVEKYNFKNSGWYLFCKNGLLYSQDGDREKAYIGRPCHTDGTVIGVKLQDGNLSFSVNGEDKGVAFSGLPDDVYPAFEMFVHQCEFELV